MSTLSNWKIREINNCKEFPPYLLYFSRKENFKSILNYGILSQTEVKKKKYLSKVLQIKKFKIFVLENLYSCLIERNI